MKKSKHIHKYILVKSNYTSIWKCAIAGCTTIMYSYLRDAMIGRFSLCNGCGAQFTLTEDNLTEDFPTCAKCKLGIGNIDDMDLIHEMGLDND